MAKKKKIVPVFWLTGNYYECNKAWADIVAKVDDPNIEVVHCGYNPVDTVFRVAEAADIILLLKMKDIFDDRPRIIKMKGIPNDYTLITDYLGRVNNNNVLVIDGPIGYYKSKRFIPAGSSKFYKTISSIGNVLKFDLEAKTPAKAVDWVASVSAEIGLKIGSEAIRHLVGRKGRNLDKLYADLLKLKSYKEANEITVEDVANCCLSVYDQTTWDLRNSAYAGDLDACITQLEHLYEHSTSTGVSAFSKDIEKLLGGLYHELLFLIYVKDGCQNGLSYEGAKRSVAGIKKLTKDNKGTDRYSAGAIAWAMKDKGFRAGSNWSKQKVYQAFRDLHRCRRMVRCSTNIQSKMCVTAFLMACCDKINETEALSLMGFSRREIERKLVVR